MNQHTNYLRTQLTDTEKWRLHQYHTELLKDIRNELTPVVTSVVGLQEERTTYNEQLQSVMEELSVIKEKTLPPLQPQCQSIAVQTNSALKTNSTPPTTSSVTLPPCIQVLMLGCGCRPPCSWRTVWILFPGQVTLLLGWT